jgi:RNA polymerase sigma-70 factor (ECF subfamily)
LYKRYQPRLLRLLQPFRDVESPEEIIQDIFLKLWLKREFMTGLRSVEHYLYRMARNRLMDLHRSKQARQAREKEALLLSGSPGLFSALEYKEFYAIVLQTLEQLPERQRLIYRLSVFQDRSLDEIAAELGFSKAVVIKQLYLANKYIRAALRQHPSLEWPDAPTLVVLGLLFSKFS